VTTDEVLVEYSHFLRRLWKHPASVWCRKAGLADCISMQTMRREGIAEALTNTAISSKQGSEHCSADRVVFTRRIESSGLVPFQTYPSPLPAFM
jgi:hypothetical protein